AASMGVRAHAALKQTRFEGGGFGGAWNNLGLAQYGSGIWCRRLWGAPAMGQTVRARILLLNP
ncbi:MAG: hypothetical protein ACI9AQ_002205, partial [Dinoroseobacter sp.]